MKASLTSVIACITLISLSACTSQPAPGGAKASVKPAAAAPAPWVHTFAPLRQVWVSPEGTGSGEAAGRATNIATAAQNSKAGDLIWLAGGEYDFAKLDDKNEPVAAECWHARAAHRLPR